MSVLGKVFSSHAKVEPFPEEPFSEEEKAAPPPPSARYAHQQIFALVHAGKSRKDVYESMQQSAIALKVLIALTLALASATLALGAAELIVIGRSSEPAVIVAASSVVVLAAILGLVGLANLKAALASDDDGKETWAQRLIELYVWTFLSMMLVLLLVGGLYFSAPVDDERVAALMGSRFPSTFAPLADALGVGTAPSAVGDVGAYLHGLRVGGAVLAILLALLMVPTLVLSG